MFATPLIVAKGFLESFLVSVQAVLYTFALIYCGEYHQLSVPEQYTSNRLYNLLRYGLG
ncbi:MAG: hypothetical protein ACJA0T_000264 [Colwellia sp.]|jgi:hypothetical protein